MTDVTLLLRRIAEGDSGASDELLPLVYDELRILAGHRIKRRNANNSLQATELVHEAYLRLVRTGERLEWDSRGHFFAAAAEAMRRIIVDRVRRNVAEKRGGGVKHERVDEQQQQADSKSKRLLDLNAALEVMESQDERAATLVKLRYFVGMQHSEAAEAMGISRRQADRIWLIAKSWLYKELSDG